MPYNNDKDYLKNKIENYLVTYRYFMHNYYNETRLFSGHYKNSLTKIFILGYRRDIIKLVKRYRRVRIK